MRGQLPNTEKWLTLSEAAEQLSVHPTTLRRWADNGDIPVMLTPGGHRRFAAADVTRLTQVRHGRRQVNDIEQIWANRALAETRKEVVVHKDDQWLTRFDDEARQRNRLLGRRLMGLTLQYLSDQNGGEILEEARTIGRQYGQIALESALPLTDALEASIFFRDMLVETALHLPESVRIRSEANRQLLHRINTLLNAVHLAVADVYHAAYADNLSGN